MFKLLSPTYLFYFLVIFTIESVFRLLGAVVKGRWHFFRAYFNASLNIIKSLREILGERRSIQSRRKFSARELFLIHQGIPQPLMKYGIPVLSLDIIQRIYLPVILAGKTYPLPEFDPESGFPDEQKIYPGKKSIFSQMASVLRIEGISGLINRTGRLVAWRLNRM